MTLGDFYLVCFLIGFLLSVVSLMLGHFDLHFHLPHGDVGLPHLHVGHNGVHAGAHGTAGHAEAQVSPFNFGTIAAFLAWFGGSGYLLTKYSTFWYLLAMLVAFVCGLVGAAVVFWFLTKLIKAEENLDPADYEMVGVLGRVVSTIREGGTGEIVFVQGGTRHTAGARSEDGTAMARETEVVVTRYEGGIAYVRRWEELANEVNSGAGEDEGLSKK